MMVVVLTVLGFGNKERVLLYQHIFFITLQKTQKPSEQP